MHIGRWLLQIGLVLLLWGGAPPIGLAASAIETPAIDQATSIPTKPSADNISSEKISQFIQSYLNVLALVEQREVELQQAETETESLRIQQEIEAEALKLIEAAGLTWQEYLQLLGLANYDPEFGERVVSQLQEAAHLLQSSIE